MKTKFELMKGLVGLIAGVMVLSGCAKPDSQEQLAERARLEAREQVQAELDLQLKQKDKMLEKTRNEARAAAEEELSAQLANQDQLIEKARAEGRAVAEEGIRTQIAHQDELVEKARAEGRAQAEEQIRLENGNLENKSKAMEEDLANRHRFYQAAAGTYEGSFKTEQGNFNIRITLVPSLPPYPVDRVRQLDEVTADLNNLYFNAQIIQWAPSNPLSSVGCRVENVRPDLVNGTISIASSSCANLYIFNVSNQESRTKGVKSSKDLAGAIRVGANGSGVDALVGEVRPTTNASIYQVFAEKKGK